jgi:hypothetical protein
LHLTGALCIVEPKGVVIAMKARTRDAFSIAWKGKVAMSYLYDVA